MTNSGCSPLNGFSRKWFARVWPASTGRPPVHSGMVPAALPAFSAPIGVRVVPSWLISDCDRLCADTAVATMLRANPQAPIIIFCICMFLSIACLETHAEADRGEVAVNQGVLLAIKEGGVADAGVVLVGVVGVQTHADRLGFLGEVGAVTLNVVGPGDVRAQVDTGNHVAVIQGGADAVAPGEVGEEAVVLTPAGGTRRGVSSRNSGVGRACAIGIGALAEQRVSTELGGAVSGADGADIVRTHFTHQRQAARAEDPIDEMHGAHRGLPELLAFVTCNVITRSHCTGQVTVGVIRYARSQQQRCTAHVPGVDLQRHVLAVADFTGYGGAADVGTEADAVQTDVFRMLEEVTSATEGLAVIAGRERSAEGTGACLVGVDGRAAVVVEGVETELGIVQGRYKPAEGYTVLPAVTGFLVLAHAGDVGARRLLALGQVQTGEHEAVVTAAADHVGTGEEGTAVIGNGAMPLQLVKRFDGQVLGQTLGEIQHFDRQQTFLQLGARAAESGGIDRVDGVDAVLDEDTFTPADHLATQADVAGVIADGIVVVDKGVQQLNARALLQRVAAGVVEVIETLAAVLRLEVVPVVAADERAGITVAQFQVMGSLEDLGKDVPCFVVESPIVGGACGGFAPLTLAINLDESVDETPVRVGRRHA